ncbi:MAG: hypothetical protein A2005_07020 [Desulfuromonadales bacterium GWC2_61_20]|nr:MAG: hypothetical protein A2005_07020 [Desulfuromonadales bacterium GWC2_61_20]HAD04045.1 hypothetical protein [Desulfuromonas sp.]
MPTDDQAARLALAKNILGIFCVLSSHLRIYQQGNQVVRVTMSRLMLQLEKFFALSDNLDLVVARHGFIHDGIFVDRANAIFQKLANHIFMHGVASIKVHKSVSEFEIVTFLRLIGRKPAETWDEGGLRECLEVRRIDNIEVVELTEHNFRLLDEGAGGEGGAAAEQSDLWDRFALSIFQRQRGGTAPASAAAPDPAELARETSTYLESQASDDKQRFLREVTNFLVSLQHENIRIYRSKALEKLTGFVNHLSPDLKRMFLRNVFNLNLRADFAEGFFSALSDDLIIDALKSAATGKSYVPPVVLNLLGKLARNRELLPADSPLLRGEGSEEIEAKTRELFKADEFEKYVPENYRNTLLQLLRSDKLEGGMVEGLARLKATLQDERLEEHTGRVVVYILGHDADERHLPGLFGTLKTRLETYADAGDYIAINDILQLCEERGSVSDRAIMRILASPELMTRILGGARNFGKEKFASLRTLIAAVGYPFVELILDRLANENNRAVRYFYMECLRGLGPVVAERAGQRLTDGRWYYLRNLLFLLRELGDPSLAGKVRPFFDHPHAKVRHEAIKTGLSFHDAAAQGVLLEQLEAEEAGAVTAAVIMARMSRDRRVIARLIALLEENKLFRYDLELKRAVVTTLVEIDPELVFPALQRVLASRNLLHARQHAELKVDIVKALGRGNPELVGEFLGRLAASGKGDLARVAGDVVARMKGASS